MTLTTKWWWHIISSHTIHCRSFSPPNTAPTKDLGGSNIKNSSNTSGFWKGVNISKKLFWPSVSFYLSKRKVQISFWYDRWCLDVPLRSLFLTAFELALDKKIAVSDCWRHNKWRVPLRRDQVGIARRSLPRLDKCYSVSIQQARWKTVLYGDGSLRKVYHSFHLQTLHSMGHRLPHVEFIMEN